MLEGLQARRRITNGSVANCVFAMPMVNGANTPTYAVLRDRRVLKVIAGLLALKA